MAQKKNNSRKISALSPKDLFKKHVIKRKVAIHIRNYLLLILFFQATLLVAILFFLGFLLQEKVSIRGIKEKDYLYWSSVADQYPNQPDILFNAAKSSYENGEKSKASEYVKKALQIDPLFEKAQKLLGEVDK